MKMNSPALAFALLPAALVFAQASPQPSDSAKAVPQVQTVTPIAAAESRTYTIPGRTEAFESTTIFTRATGIVKERRFDIGDHVKAGDVMATINAPEIDRAVESANAMIDQAEARAENARLLAERAASLLETRAIAQAEVDLRNSNAAETAAAVRFAKTELARFKEQQGFATVYAPFSGVIAARNFNRGDRVRGDSSTADGWLYRLVELNKLRFVIAAPPDLALRLKAGDTAKIRFAEFPGSDLKASLYRTSGVFDDANGTMRVELLIENPDLTIPAGLTGSATFTLGQADRTFLVPNNTITTTRGQASLSTVQSGKVKVLRVAVGRSLGTNTEVTSAELTPETQIIINPNAMLRAGDEVRAVTGKGT